MGTRCRCQAELDGLPSFSYHPLCVKNCGQLLSVFFFFLLLLLIFWSSLSVSYVLPASFLNLFFLESFSLPVFYLVFYDPMATISCLPRPSQDY